MIGRSFRDLRIWQNGKELAIETYKLTKEFPRQEEFGLTSQMRRASVSISANIAEGFNRSQPIEFKRYLHIALGSCAELETFIEIARDLDYISSSTHQNFLLKIGIESRMIMNYIKRIARYHQPSTIIHQRGLV